MPAGEGIGSDMLFARHIDWVESIRKGLCFKVEKSRVVDGCQLLLAKEGEEGAVVKAKDEVRETQDKEPALLEAICSSQGLPLYRVVSTLSS